MNFLINIYHMIAKFVGLFFKGGVHASAKDVFDQQMHQTAERTISIDQQLKKIYESHGYKWDPKKDCIGIQDPSGTNIFNDYNIRRIKGKWFRWRSTCAGGTKTKGFWRSMFECRQYLNLYEKAKGNFPKGGKYPLPYMRMTRPVWVIDMESGKRRKAGDCHCHGTKYKLKNMAINMLGLGCNVLYRPYLGIQTFMKYILDNTKYHFTVININEAPFVHKIPFYEGEK